MDIALHIDRNGIDAPEDDAFQRWVTAALSGAHERWQSPQRIELSIQLVTTQAMTRFNQQYRGKATDTNVLAFPVETALQKQTGLLGDVIICGDVVDREARTQKKALEHHWAHMTIHGTLHLIGYDHVDEHDAETMETLEIARLNDLCIPDPYNTKDTLPS